MCCLLLECLVKNGFRGVNALLNNQVLDPKRSVRYCKGMCSEMHANRRLNPHGRSGTHRILKIHSDREDLPSHKAEKAKRKDCRRRKAKQRCCADGRCLLTLAGERPIFVDTSTRAVVLWQEETAWDFLLLLMLHLLPDLESSTRKDHMQRLIQGQMMCRPYQEEEAVPLALSRTWLVTF